MGAWGVTIWPSDISLKKNISNCKVSALDSINQLKHREFVWKDNDVKQDLGYIAQEIQEVIPGSTITVKQPDGSELLQINETAIIPYITKAIQELSAEVDLLKEENEKLKNEILNLRR